MQQMGKKAKVNDSKYWSFKMLVTDKGAEGANKLSKVTL